MRQNKIGKEMQDQEINKNPFCHSPAFPATASSPGPSRVSLYWQMPLLIYDVIIKTFSLTQCYSFPSLTGGNQMACSRLSRHFFIKDDNFMVNNKIQKTCQESSIWSGKESCVKQTNAPGRFVCKCAGFFTHKGDLTSIDEWWATQVSLKLKIQKHG